MKPNKPEVREQYEQAAAFYAAALRNSPGVDFLQGRKITGETAQRFRLGFVSEPFTEEHKHLAGRLCIPNITVGPSGEERVVGLKFRSLAEGRQDTKFLSPPKAGPARIYNLRALREARDVIAVTEGECLPYDAEVLTPDGWVQLGEYDGQEVAQWSTDGQLEMVLPLAYVKKPFTGNMVSLAQRGFTSLTTPTHKIPTFHKGRFEWKLAGEFSGQGHVPRTGMLDGPGIDLTDDEIKLLIAIQADATIDTRESGAKYVRFTIAKQRKRDRLHKITANLGIEISDNEFGSRPGTRSICFTVPANLRPFKMFPWSWITQASRQQRDMILTELIHWNDSIAPNRDQAECSSKWKANAEWAQALAHTSIARENQRGEWWKASLLHGKGSSDVGSLTSNKDFVKWDDMVYCLRVPTRAFLVRQNGHITVTGNSDSWTVAQVGIPVVAIPGVSNWKPYRKRILSGFGRVILCRDNDEAAKGLENAMGEVDGLEVCIPEPFKDVSEFFMERGPEALRALILGEQTE